MLSEKIRVGVGQYRRPYILRQSRSRRQPVEIEEKRFGYFPKRFRWRGKLYDVQAIEHCTTKMFRRPQLCFRVRCREGAFELIQDVKSNIWQLERVQ